MSDHRDGYYGVGVALSRMGVHIARTFAERLEPLGLTTSHAALLRILGHNKHASHQELGRKLGLSGYRISALIDALQAAEIVVVGSPEHPNEVELTDKGREVYGQMIHCAVTYEQELLAPLSTEDARAQQRILRLLEASTGVDQNDPVPPETLATTLGL